MTSTQPQPTARVSGRSTSAKALRLNLDEKKYGTIAEIGAGQEVARHFFLAGAAAGTVAKTMSAYDMQFSDAIYGVQDGGRYVSYDRVNAMLETEFSLVVDRVKETRPKASRFFAYAATVSAKSYNRDNECHAWCGVRVQTYPGAEASNIIIHVRMRDKTAEMQQETLGVVGVNLIYAAYYYFEDPRKLINSLTDNLGSDQIEIDSIFFNGPYFEDIDNQAINLHLIRSWKTRAIIFNPDGTVAVPSNILYKKNVLTIRGSFKPITNLNVDMIEQSKNAFQKAHDVTDKNTLVLAEITLNDLNGNDLMVPEEDLIHRVTQLNALGYSVMISDYTRYFSLRAYFRQYTSLQIGIVLGMKNVREIFDEETYVGVEGGILEGFGKLFPDNTRLFVYPELNEAGELQESSSLKVPDHLRYLYRHLLENEFISSINCGNRSLLSIYSRKILAQLPNGPGDWEQKIPPQIAEQIKTHRLFGYRP